MGSHRRSGKRSRRAVMAATLAVGLAAFGLTPFAEAAQTVVGPVDPSTRVPFWVADSSGGTRLDLCLDAQQCLGTRASLVAPDGEAFWYSASTAVSGKGASGLYEVATEAAFAGAGTDQEIGFNRLRVRLDVSSPGTYEVRHPYGTRTYVVARVDSKRFEINETLDVGCTTPTCGDFGGLSNSGDGGIGDSWLRWDPAAAPAAPAGFLGDGLTEHAVIGSPIGRNVLDVVRTKNDKGQILQTPEVAAHMTRFAVQGRVARPQVVATPAGGSYQGTVTVRLVGSEPNASIYYTDDGSAPAKADGSLTDLAKPYTGQLTLTTTTTVRAVNVVGGAVVTDLVTGKPSAASSDTYAIDAGAPTLTVSPAGGTFSTAQHVTLTATDTDDASPKIYYAVGQGTEPADPTRASTLYTGPIPVNGNADGAATTIKAIAIDAAGNASSVVKESYLVNAAALSASPRGGSYGSAQDVTLTATDPDAKIYYTTDGTQPTGDAAGNATTGTAYTNDAIHLTDYTTLRFVAVTVGGQSSVMTENYLIDIPANRPKGALGSVGPVDAANGYPFWYGDKGDALAGQDPVRLELCLDDPLCPVVGDKPNAAEPAAFPDNFPDESFWWAAESALTTPSGASGLLVLGQEAAFGGAGNVAVGQQIGFARLRIRINDVSPNETYTITSPYGVDVVQADDRGRVFFTEDLGCLAAPCDWTQPLDGRVGPFLRWDPSSAPAAPAGYLGDAVTEHTVVGSPHGTNFFRIDGPGIGGTGVDTVQTDLFTVQGKIARLHATVSPQGGLYSGPQTVTMTASFPGEAGIVYTSDGTDPAVDPTTGTVMNGTAGTTLDLPPGTTTLRFMAVDLSSHQTSTIYTETYQVDGALPTVSATPDPQDNPFQGGQVVHLTAQVDGVAMASPPAMYFTTDGTLPRLVDGIPQGTTQTYDEQAGVPIGRPTTVRALALSASGAPGPVASFDYVIQNLASYGPISPANGFPTWFQDYGDRGQGLDPLRLELCLSVADCPVIGDVPNPDAPVSFPGNFPDEAFWWSGEAAFTRGGVSARLTLADEAAFANGGVKQGDQIGFGRTRLKASGLVPGATYEVTQPYGVLMLTAGADGTIFVTDDAGCLNGPCQWSEVLKAPIGPFLRWDKDAPAGFLGDPGIPHTVVGSPFGTNVFSMQQVTDATGAGLPAPVLVGTTDQFVVQGKLASLQVTATPKGGTYTSAQQVMLSSNDSSASIYYTVDGSEPNDQGTKYDGPVSLSTDGEHVLKFVAVAADGSRSSVGTETYLIDTAAPDVAADPEGGSWPSAKDVTLSSTDPTAKIYYTLNGSTPSSASTPCSGPVTISKTSTLKAVAIDPAGNRSLPGSWTFTIGLATTSMTLGTPTPSTVTFGGTTTLTGTLSSGGAALNGQPVVLQSKALNATTWVPGPEVSTSTDGSYTFTGVSPSATVDYRASFAGDAGYQAQASAPQRVSVRAVVTLDPLVAAVSRGKSVTYSGTLAPIHSGARITITVSRAGQRTSTASGTVAANGSWSVTAKAPGQQGIWTVVASWAGDTDHLAGQSDPKALNVVK